MSNQIWLTVTEVSDFGDLTTQAIRKAISENRFITRKRTTGKGYEILLTSLPSPIQSAYKAKQAAADTSARAISIRTAVFEAKTAQQAKRIMIDAQNADVSAALAKLHDTARSRITTKIAYCEAARAADLVGKSRIHVAVIEFCRIWNLENGFGDCGGAADGGRADAGKRADTQVRPYNGKPLTPKTLENNLREYHKHGSAAFLGEGNRGGAKRDTSTVPDEMQAIFVPYALREQVGSFKRGYDAVRGHYAQIPGFDMTTIPSLPSFVRRLHRDVPKDVIERCTRGVDWWKRNHADFVQKSSEKLMPGEVWVSDHMECPVVVQFPDGTTGKPWLSSWMDYRTHKLLGWDIHKGAGNADHNFLTFKRACERFDPVTGEIFWESPRDVLTDNGLDYKAKDLINGQNRGTAGRLPSGDPSGWSEDEQRRCRALFAGLSIRVHFTIPYNSDGKPIERMQGIWQGFFFDYLPMATGRSVANKRFGGMAQKPDTREVAAMLTLEALREKFKFFVDEIWHKHVFASGERKGMSPGMIWNEGIAEARRTGLIRRVSEEALSLFCMRTSLPRQISKNGVKDAKLNRYYWAEWMAGMKGESVYLRRDPEKWDTAYVFSAESDKFLGTAPMGAVCDAIVRDDAGRELLSEEMRRVGADKRRVENARKVLQGEIAPESHLGGLAALAAYEEREAMDRRGLAMGRDAQLCVSTDEPVYHSVHQVTVLDNVAKMVGMAAEEGMQEISGMMDTSHRSPNRPRLFETEADKILWEEEQGYGRYRNDNAVGITNQMMAV